MSTPEQTVTLTFSVYEAAHLQLALEYAARMNTSIILAPALSALCEKVAEANRDLLIDF